MQRCALPFSFRFALSYMKKKKKTKKGFAAMKIKLTFAPL